MSEQKREPDEEPKTGQEAEPETEMETGSEMNVEMGQTFEDDEPKEEQKPNKERKPKARNNFKETTPKSMMPRERLWKHGVDVLNNDELIAILLRTGLQGTDVLKLSKDILITYNNSLYAMMSAGAENLKKDITGLGLAKAVTLIAALELGRRAQIEILSREPLDSPKKAYNFFVNVVGRLDHEEFWVAVLDNQNKLLKSERVTEGGFTSTNVDIRKLMSIVLRNNGVGIMVAHNHPSGSKEPSRADRDLTNRIAAACETLSIRLLDHIIVARGNGYYSFHDAGELM